MAENNSTCRQAGRDCPGSTGLNGNAHGPRLGTAPTQVCVCVCVCVYVSCSVVSDSLRLHGLQPTRLFCPQNSPGKNTGMGCHALLQGISSTQGSLTSPALAGSLIHTSNYLGVSGMKLGFIPQEGEKKCQTLHQTNALSL